MELPPRARRIPLMRCHSTSLMGTTSACAENTRIDRTFACSPQNYLRVRGEYRPVAGSISNSTELPPRARRIPSCKSWGRPNRGTTSACAENTRKPGKPLASLRNYLRVRGEYMPLSRASRMILELPPRARRILDGDTTIPHRRGTTSACAENTKRG